MISNPLAKQETAVSTVATYIWLKRQGLVWLQSNRPKTLKLSKATCSISISLFSFLVVASSSEIGYTISQYSGGGVITVNVG